VRRIWNWLPSPMNWAGPMKPIGITVLQRSFLPRVEQR
jgi:hypothetical protein